MKTNKSFAGTIGTIIIMATLFLGVSVSQHTRAENPPICDYNITELQGTQSSNHAGVRKSSSLIKIVGIKSTGSGSNSVEIDLVAVPSGTKLHKEPTWSGHNVEGVSGNLTAKWKAGLLPTDSAPTATACAGQSSLRIEHVAPLSNKIEISTHSAGSKEVIEQIETWLTKYSKKPVWKVTGGINGSIQRCDFFNDASKIGCNAEFGGFLSIEAPGFSIDDSVPDLPTGIPGLYWKPIASFDPFKFNGEVKGVFNEEKQNPWVNPAKGELSGEVGVAAGAKLGIGKDGVAEASISAVGKCGLKATVNFGSGNKSITLEEYKVNIGELRGEVTLKILLMDCVDWQTKLVDHTFWKGVDLPSTKAPANPITLYKFSNP